jgi:DNA-directed RNA polymerase subunit alpha
MTNELNSISPKIVIKETATNQGIFTLSPLPPGFGTTIGSAIRRTLFSSQEGYAITKIKFNPIVEHEFASIDGVLEDVQEIILNLKQVRLKKTSEEAEEVIVVSLNGKKSFKAEDIAKASRTFEVMNPELVICTMDEGVVLEIEFVITKGKGYVSAKEHKGDKQVIGVFPIDTIYAPIVNVQVNIDNVLVGQRTDYEKLVMDIVTDGTISPEGALRNASKVLRDTFAILVDSEVAKSSEQEKKEKEGEEDHLRIHTLLKRPLSELELSARVINSLSANGFECLKDLVGKTESDFLKLSNFGKKCMDELVAFFNKENITWKLK